MHNPTIGHLPTTHHGKCRFCANTATINVSLNHGVNASVNYCHAIPCAKKAKQEIVDCWHKHQQDVAEIKAQKAKKPCTTRTAKKEEYELKRARQRKPHLA